MSQFHLNGKIKKPGNYGKTWFLGYRKYELLLAWRKISTTKLSEVRPHTGYTVLSKQCYNYFTLYLIADKTKNTPNINKP